MRSIAIINPLGDYGINTYCFELAEALGASGTKVDVYTGNSSPLSELPLPQHHRCFPVMGSALFKQRHSLSEIRTEASSPLAPASAPQAAAVTAAKPRAVGENTLRSRLRNVFLEVELAFCLKWKRYDLVWTQWPNVYGSSFWGLCRTLGVRTAHTVHNVLPHEAFPEQIEVLRRVYGRSDALVVHSEASRADFVSIFPESQGKVLVAPHGTYTIYPRKPEARERLREQLGIRAGSIACLLCGGIRPYKNIDAVLGALGDERCTQIVFIVAGQESGYPDASPGDPLARTRRLAERLGIIDRVKLIPRFLHTVEMAEFFEASDILVLPYMKNYGSGLLLLGITFGKYIVTTDTGGAGEYLANYPDHTLLEGSESHQVAEGLSKAVEALTNQPRATVGPNMPELQWPVIARDLLGKLSSALGTAS